MRIRFTKCFVLLVCATLVFSQAHSKDLSRPDFYEQITPDFLSEPIKSSFSLPNLPSQESDKKNILVKTIQIKGNTVLTREKIKPLFQTIIGKNVSSAELEQLRIRVSKRYFDEGYINSGVVLPKQDYKNGIVVFLAIEGELDKIRITGTTNIDKNNLIEGILKAAGKPLNVHSLQKNLDMINAMPGVSRLHASLEAGKSAGKSNLTVQIEEAKLYRFIFGADNYRTPVIGAERAFAAFQHNNLTGHSDTLLAQAGLTQGMNDYFIRYTYPLNQYQSQISAYYVKSDAQIIDSNLANLPDISNNSSVYGLNWQYDFLNTSSLGFKHLIVGVERLKNKNTILGKQEETVISLSSLYNFNAYMATHSLRPKTRIGSTRHLTADGVDSNTDSFTTVKLNTESLWKQVNANHRIQVKTKLQLAVQSLTTQGLERLAIGGHDSVRGYRENTVVRDNGLVLNVNYITPLNISKLSVLYFLDSASAWNEGQLAESEKLLSIGAGLNWNNRKNMNVDGSIGLPLMNKPEGGGNLQDFGIHFGVQYIL